MKESHVLRTYTVGFILSLILTIIAYALVSAQTHTSHDIIPHVLLIAILLVVALVQLSVQLIFFLHLGRESKPQWNVVFFVSTFSAVVIVIVASIWIMNHLNYNMTPSQVNQYIQNQAGGF